jgi:hypothetical protein
VIKRYCLFPNIDITSVISEYEKDKLGAHLEGLKKDHFNKNIFFIFIAAFLTTYTWKMIA